MSKISRTPMSPKNGRNPKNKFHPPRKRDIPNKRRKLEVDTQFQLEYQFNAHEESNQPTTDGSMNTHTSTPLSSQPSVSDTLIDQNPTAQYMRFLPLTEQKPVSHDKNYQQTKFRSPLNSELCVVLWGNSTDRENTLVEIKTVNDLLMQRSLTKTLNKNIFKLVTVTVGFTDIVSANTFKSQITNRTRGINPRTVLVDLLTTKYGHDKYKLQSFCNFDALLRELDVESRIELFPETEEVIKSLGVSTCTQSSSPTLQDISSSSSSNDSIVFKECTSSSGLVKNTKF